MPSRIRPVGSVAGPVCGFEVWEPGPTVPRETLLGSFHGGKKNGAWEVKSHREPSILQREKVRLGALLDFSSTKHMPHTSHPSIPETKEGPALPGELTKDFSLCPFGPYQPINMVHTHMESSRFFSPAHAPSLSSAFPPPVCSVAFTSKDRAERPPCNAWRRNGVEATFTALTSVAALRWSPR